MTNGYMRNASAIYQQNSIRGGIEDADPHQLVGMLLDGAIERVVQARGHMVHGNVAAKGSSISRALAIVGELRNSLDHKADRVISQRLDSLYEYVSRRLLFAQLNNDPEALDEVARLLTPIRDGWHGIRDSYLTGNRQVAGAMR
ncbi:flagellar export chaperone FliS [Rhodanobacter ginsengisoli]|uniref:Flagellar secretion chaperone FliS n=1 Tax=Rhodanobacter ginsengisoli TaxID=418646 RepID=A0ABW0QKJ2_9GAMM